MKHSCPTRRSSDLVPLPGARWNGKAVEPVTGRSLVPMLEGAADGVHGDAPLGYELAGNAALFRGDFKLVRNLPPIGDGGWRLYDLRTAQIGRASWRERVCQYV